MQPGSRITRFEVLSLVDAGGKGKMLRAPIDPEDLHLRGHERGALPRVGLRSPQSTCLPTGRPWPMKDSFSLGAPEVTGGRTLRPFGCRVTVHLDPESGAPLACQRISAPSEQRRRDGNSPRC